MRNAMAKYTDKIIYMEGIIVEVHDGAVGIDLKGRLGYMKIPMRMLITDYEINMGIIHKILHLRKDKIWILQ